MFLVDHAKPRLIKQWKKLLNSFTNILRYIDDFIYSLLKKDSNINVLLIVRNSISISVFLPLIREFKNRKNIDITITEEYKGCYAWPQHGEVAELKRLHFKEPSKCIFLKWHYIFVTDISTIWFKRHHIKVSVSHGWAYNIGLKSKAATTVADSYNYLQDFSSYPIDLYFHNSTYDFSVIRELLPSTNKSLHVVSGFCKADSFALSESLNSEKSALSKPKQNKNINIVLTSHFRKESLLQHFGIEVINTIMHCRENISLVVLGHAVLWRNNEALFQQIKALAEKNNKIVFLPDLGDNTPILESANVFIGDYSSIFFEFCIIDKPILRFEHPQFEFGNIEIGDAYRDASMTFTKLSEIPNLIEQAIQLPSLQSSSRQNVVKKFVPNIGDASKIIADTLEQLGPLTNRNQINGKAP